MSEIDLILGAVKGYSGSVVAVVLLGYLAVRAISSALASRGSTVQRAGGQAVSAGGDVSIGSPSAPEVRCPPDVERTMARIALATEQSMNMMTRQGEILAQQTLILQALSADSRVAHDVLQLLQEEARADASLRNGLLGSRAGQ